MYRPKPRVEISLNERVDAFIYVRGRQGGGAALGEVVARPLLCDTVKVWGRKKLGERAMGHSELKASNVTANAGARKFQLWVLMG